MYGVVNEDQHLLYVYGDVLYHLPLYVQATTTIHSTINHFSSECVFSTVLDYIMNNLTNHLESTQANVERIAQDLMSWNTGLKELEEALKQGEKAVNKTILMNVGNEDVLSDIMVLIFVFHKVLNNDNHIHLFSKLQFTVSCTQNHRMMFENKQDDILSDLSMIRGILSDTEDLQNMMNNLKNVRHWDCNVSQDIQYVSLYNTYISVKQIKITQFGFLWNMNLAGIHLA